MVLPSCKFPDHGNISFPGPHSCSSDVGTATVNDHSSGSCKFTLQHLYPDKVNSQGSPVCINTRSSKWNLKPSQKKLNG
eukprot:c24656_g1_i1 orf=534-770(-)